MSGTPYTTQPGSEPLTFCMAGECSNITVMNYDLRKRQIEILFIVNLSKPYNNFNFPEVLCEKKHTLGDEGTGRARQSAVGSVVGVAAVPDAGPVPFCVEARCVLK